MIEKTTTYESLFVRQGALSPDVTTQAIRSCAVCGCKRLVPFAQRSDGVHIVRCAQCGMGVVDHIPDDLLALYGDDYYGMESGCRQKERGYTDYAYTAEHGVGWAAALVKLLRPAGGRVLDIGCADGHLLGKLGRGYTTFGIEANEATGRIAAERGVVVLGRDLLDADLIEGHRGSFDVITAIAVFEHLRDIRSGMQAALGMLRDDGVLLFEVPLMSAVHDNTMWLTSSLEHVWYPSEQSLQQLVQIELDAELVGTELFITGYASNYVGLVFRKSADSRSIRELAARVVLRKSEPISTEQAIARMFLHLVHGAAATQADVSVLAKLPTIELNPQLLRRLAEQWQADLHRLALAGAETEKAHAHARRLKADLDAAESDRVRSNTELTASLVASSTRMAAMQTDLDTRIAAEVAFGEQKATLDKDRADLNDAAARLAAAQEVADAARTAAIEAEQRAADRQRAVEAELAEIQSGMAWRVAVVLREVARRHPRVARRARQIARVLWWTLHGRLISQLRFRRRVRAQLRAEAAAAGATSSLPVQTPLPPDLQAYPAEVQTSSPLVQPLSPPDAPTTAPISSSNFHTKPAELLPSRRTSTLGRLSLLKERGHRPPLPSGPEQPEDWPLVSVVVTSFNYGRFVMDAVDSVLAQTFKDLEVIVVEGGSSDSDSRFVVAELERPRCRVLMQGGSHRAGQNRNFGISQARGHYICCLDADDMLAPTYIEKAVFLLERHGYDVVSSAMELMGAEHGQLNITEQPDLEDLLNGNEVLTCAVFRRSFWEQAGGYRDVDPAVSGYVYEDWAFWIRLAALGARFWNLHHDPMLRYRVHTASLSRGKNVLPISRQRQIVCQMNQDVLQSVSDKIALSRRLAAIRYGTPCAPPAPLILARPQPDMQQRTLLLAMPFLILGGAERLLSAIVAHLVELGWRVVITTSIDPGANRGDTTPWFECYTGEIFHLPRGFPSELWEDFVHHLVRSRGVNVIWIVGSAFAYDCLRGLRAAHPGLRVADLLFNTVGHTANNRRRRDLIDLIFVENNEVHDWLVAHGEDGSRLRLVKSGVDLAALRPMKRSRAFEQQIGAAPTDLVVGFSGRWSSEKNPVGFVEIARLVDPALPVRFVVTGTGNLRSDIERAVHEACFPEGRFHLLGEISEFAPVLASFDLLVVPSLLDGRPVVVLEALSMGVPVVASRVGALPELVQDSEAGWLCEPGDSGEFAKCIERAARDRTGLLDMRRRAREYAESALDIQAMLASYEEGLTSLLPENLGNA